MIGKKIKTDHIIWTLVGYSLVSLYFPSIKYGFSVGALFLLAHHAGFLSSEENKTKTSFPGLNICDGFPHVEGGKKHT